MRVEMQNNGKYLRSEIKEMCDGFGGEYVRVYSDFWIDDEKITKQFECRACLVNNQKLYKIEVFKCNNAKWLEIGKEIISIGSMNKKAKFKDQVFYYEIQ